MIIQLKRILQINVKKFLKFRNTVTYINWRYLRSAEVANTAMYNDHNTTLFYLPLWLPYNILFEYQLCLSECEALRELDLTNNPFDLDEQGRVATNPAEIISTLQVLDGVSNLYLVTQYFHSHHFHLKMFFPGSIIAGIQGVNSLLVACAISRINLKPQLLI